MARKRMSLRSIAAMKRENRRLREKIDEVRRIFSAPEHRGIAIASGTVCTDATSAIRTSIRLGFTNLVVVRDDGALQVRAVKPDFNVLEA